MASGKEGKKRVDKARKAKVKARLAKRRPMPKVIVHPTPYAGEVPATVIADIIAKRDLLVDPTLAETVLRRYLGKHVALAERMTDPTVLRSAAYEDAKKWVRQELRVLVGLFIIETDLRRLLHADARTVLAAHRSTAERLVEYPTLYEPLFAGREPKHILDLCAGLNSCAYEYLGCAPRYDAIDVSPQLMDFTQAWFTKHQIPGTARASDVTKLTAAEVPESVDMVFLFKATDVLERVKYGFGEELLTMLLGETSPTGRRVIVSFATATIGGGREIRVTKRSWVERWAAAHSCSVRMHDTLNERYYILEREA